MVALGFRQVIAIPTENAARVLAPRDIADIDGVIVAESYFDTAIRPRPPHGVVLFAPCGFNSLNKLAQGIADTLALSVAAEAIGRRTPVLVAPSLNQPLLDHPIAQASFRTLPTWGVQIIPPAQGPRGPILAPTETLLAALRPHAPLPPAAPHGT
jgi:phosphopantothenoylcysteine synthetase/decarboxylase